MEGGQPPMEQPKMKGLLKGLRYISQIFEVKEQEMQIGHPTDVKHVAHIGWDSASVTAAPSWMNEYKDPALGPGGDPDSWGPARPAPAQEPDQSRCEGRGEQAERPRRASGKGDGGGGGGDASGRGSRRREGGEGSRRERRQQRKEVGGGGEGSEGGAAEGAAAAQKQSRRRRPKFSGRTKSAAAGGGAASEAEAVRSAAAGAEGDGA